MVRGQLKGQPPGNVSVLRENEQLITENPLWGFSIVIGRIEI